MNVCLQPVRCFWVGLMVSLFVMANAQAQSFVWAKRVGGSSSNLSDAGFAITTDFGGNVYTAGRYGGTVDFDPGPGTANLTSTGLNDLFVTKFDAAGNFVWAKSFGGPGDDFAYSIAVDALGNVCFTGFFKATADFDPSANVFNITSAGDFDAFVCKLDGSGGLVWVRRVGGVGEDRGYALTINSLGSIYITGAFTNTADFDPGPGVTQFVSRSDYAPDIFVWQLDRDGNFVWVRIIGGTEFDYPSSISLDASERIYVTGRFGSTADFDPGPGVYTLTAGQSDGFVCKLNTEGNLMWVRQMGGTSGDNASSGAVMPDQGVCVTGSFTGTATFGPGVTLGTGSIYTDIFVCRYDLNGTLIWAKTMGSSNFDAGNAVGVDKTGNIYVAGTFRETVDFDPGPGTTNLNAVGVEDAFAIKLSPDGQLLWARSIGSPGYDNARAMNIDAVGDMHLTGNFEQTMDADPNSGVFNLSSAGFQDAFIVKLTGSNVMNHYSVQAGSWNQTSTWSCGCIPSSTDVVTINHAVTVPVGGPLITKQIRQGAGGKLQFTSGSRLQVGASN
ncbi:hypothetical protein F5984_00280 [Rudanella paleaurantiibacter]|uniref:SBBP repeat-containing protein n=1 Tax=Rudanella paleaurantiibacter TaxID=2614655 RepID=A0A7J5U3U1_9BACT|nr:hypothetical protein [Rudanella paleaurantiibacter]KAB7732435.1 hypothetical protein F5984_00280 [Rudanella paleaurantiibacter]